MDDIGTRGAIEGFTGFNAHKRCSPASAHNGNWGMFE
jgi:hypothetical protein